jgi:hypothetical protein
MKTNSSQTSNQRRAIVVLIAMVGLVSESATAGQGRVRSTSNGGTNNRMYSILVEGLDPGSRNGATGLRVVRGSGASANVVNVKGGDLPPDAVTQPGTRLAGFQIGRFEVSLDEWREVRVWAAANGYTDLPEGVASKGTDPVREVNWYDVVKWCNARSEREGLQPVYRIKSDIYRQGQGDLNVSMSATGYRLPRPEEWEFAVFGGVWNEENVKEWVQDPPAGGQAKQGRVRSTSNGGTNNAAFDVADAGVRDSSAGFRVARSVL